MNRLFPVIAVALLLTAAWVAVGHAAPAEQGDPVTVSIEPQTTTVAPGDVFTVAIHLQTGPDGVDSFETYLDFDPDYLRVVDSASGAESDTIVSAGAFGTIVQNSVDNAGGVIRYVEIAFPPDPLPSGSFDVARIPLEAVAATEETTLAFRGTVANVAGERLPLSPDPPEPGVVRMATTAEPTSAPTLSPPTEPAPTSTPSPEPTARPTETPRPETPTSTSPPTAQPSPTRTPTSRPTTPSPTASSAPGATPPPTTPAVADTATPTPTTPARPSTEAAEGPTATPQPDVGEPTTPDATPSAIPSPSAPTPTPPASSPGEEGSGGPSALLIGALILLLVGGGALLFGILGLGRNRRDRES